MSADTIATPETVAETYFAAWQAKDVDAIRPYFADDITFRGPLGEADDADSAAKGLAGMFGGTTEVTVLHRWIDGPDVLTWFELRMGDAPKLAVVNWSRIEDGLITRIRVTFDPRPLLG